MRNICTTAGWVVIFSQNRVPATWSSHHKRTLCRKYNFHKKPLGNTGHNTNYIFQNPYTRLCRQALQTDCSLLRPLQKRKKPFKAAQPRYFIRHLFRRRKTLTSTQKQNPIDINFINRCKYMPRSEYLVTFLQDVSFCVLNTTCVKVVVRQRLLFCSQLAIINKFDLPTLISRKTQTNLINFYSISKFRISVYK